MAAIRYIADLHFHDENILAYDNRPFLSVSEMNEALIERWNRAVGKDDLTWILGDFCMGGAEDWAGVLDRLNGHKALIIGNHDSREAVDQLRNRFEDVADYRESTDGEHHVVLCHYPIPNFRDHYFSWVHLYGHVHTGLEANIMEHSKLLLRKLYVRDDVCLAFNVGAMLPNMEYTPRTLEEILSSKT